MKRSPWVEKLFRPLVIGAMCGCIALSVTDLMHLFAPTWNATYLVVACVLAALEANYSYRRIRARLLHASDIMRFRVVEIAMFFILLKIGGYAGEPWADVLADVQTWPSQPLNILDLETVIAFILVLLSWSAATQTLRDLDQISEPPGRYRDYVPPIQKLTARFFWGGAALLIVAGIARLGLAALLDLRRPSVPGMVLNVLVYFLLGLVMLGQAQFISLRTRWEMQHTKIADRLASRWVRYSLAFIGLAALVAFLLPTGYTVGLLEVAAAIIDILVYIFTLLSLVLSFVLGLLLMPFFLLLGRERPAPRADLPSLELRQTETVPAGGAAPAWFEILRSLLFWAAALGMVFYVVRTYLHDRPELLEALASLGPIRALRDFLIGLWRHLVGFADVVKERLPRRLSLRRPRSERAGTGFRFFRLGALSPRERILYYYLSILRRAGQRGFPRQQAQTPHEYDATLGPHLPEAQQEMGQLTQAFVEARYSRHAIGREEDQQVQTVWKKVRAALRALKRGR
jgi:hypothetical protein